jgi:hypothetical protein
MLPDGHRHALYSAVDLASGGQRGLSEQHVHNMIDATSFTILRAAAQMAQGAMQRGVHRAGLTWNLQVRRATEGREGHWKEVWHCTSRDHT